jgi:hypothetical protein
MRIRFFPAAMILGTLAAALFAAGCHVQVDKDKNGDDKNVKIDTPLGGLHVRADQTSAADLGLSAYPGATISPDREGDKSADVHIGFGHFQLHVKVVTYLTSDGQQKVLAFYKQDLSRFGDVIECDGNRPVGSPTATSAGLTCKEDDRIRVKTDSGYPGDDDSGLSLRAGSKHHQHIVTFKSTSQGAKFSLVELQLPEGLDDNSGASD